MPQFNERNAEHWKLQRKLVRELTPRELSFNLKMAQRLLKLDPNSAVFANQCGIIRAEICRRDLKPYTT